MRNFIRCILNPPPLAPSPEFVLKCLGPDDNFRREV